MSIGVISLSTNQRRETGAPFPAGSADNGLSVDPVTGRIVLGNDVGDATKPAQLLSGRKIDMEGFELLLQDEITNSTGQTFLTGGSVRMLAGAGGFSQLQMSAGNNDTFNVQVTEASGFVSVGTGAFGTLNFVTIDQSNGAGQFGTPAAPFNGANVQVSGTATFRAQWYNTGGGATFNIDRDIHSGVLFSNPNPGGGLNILALPNLSSSIFVGFHFYVGVIAVDGIQIQASAGQTIYVNGAASSVGGTATSVTPGSSMHLFAVDPVTWMAIGSDGTWVLA